MVLGQDLSHRARLLSGMSRVLGEKEYAAVTVADIVSVAGVSKRTFYEHFAGKQECLLACYEQANELIMAAIGSPPELTQVLPGGDRASAVEGLTRMIDAYLALLDDHRATAVALLVEITSAGAEGRRVRRESNLALARALLRIAGLPDDDAHLSQAVALVGGVGELVTVHAESSPGRPFTELRPPVRRFVASVILSTALDPDADPDADPGS